MPGGAAPRVSRQLESSLYVADLARSRAFYENVFGFETLLDEERMVGLAVPGGSMLLLFRRGGSVTPSPVPGGLIPPHDGHGPLHVAFAIAADHLGDWEAHLGAQNIAVEGRTDWPRGGNSIYFRDPDGHLLELATPGLWPNCLS